MTRDKYRPIIEPVAKTIDAKTVAMARRQGLRYLQAAEQDTHPSFGLTHASYARVIFEELALLGVDVKELLARAGEEQDRWGKVILEKIPLRRT